ncbi:MAG: sortase [Candidatus Gracilibacteria bacterium]|nr:sortase [Candidatus Gracilibacteria bacterium]
MEKTNINTSYDELDLLLEDTLEVKIEVIQEEITPQISEDDTPDITEFMEEKKQKSKILSGIFFGVRYLLTTSMIFVVLLLTTNYSAYYNIAMSYINSDDLANKSRGLISSVEASNITDKMKEERAQQEGFLEEDTEQIKSKNSIKHLIDITEKDGERMDIEITPYQNRVIIPKIGKNIPLVDIKNRALDSSNELNNIFMKELEKGIIRYPGSAKPGKEGNSFIFGHSSNFPWIKGDYNDVFALLDNVEFDDEIIVYYNQKKYKYIIRKKHVISPGNVSVLKQEKNTSELTLMTCWPIGTTLNRLIVTAELVEEL